MALFITFEGTEGAGKSTLIRAFAKKLDRLSAQKIILTREPGGSAVAEKIRSLILDEAMHPWTELFLYEASRAEHLHRVILPALSKGHTVLCDRFSDSSLAYQGYARGLPWKTVGVLNQIATQGLTPDLTVFLDIDPALGLKNAQVQTRFEKEGLKFQRKVRQGFLKAMRESPKRWISLKARSGTPEELAEKLLMHIQNKFKKRKF